MSPITSWAAVALAIAVEAANAATLTSLVNLFIGTTGGGNAFPGAAIPHGLAKVGIDVTTAPRQAGYIHDNSSISGVSLLHDEGTGGNANGGYGVFPLFPLAGCTFASCPVAISARSVLRANNTDAAKPGYFTTTFVNGIKLETTSTRRAGLIRFTFPTEGTNHVVVDLTNDLGRTFSGGSLTISNTSRVKLGGTYLQSYGPANYTVFGCYDFAAPASVSSQRPDEFGTYQRNLSTTSTIIISQNTTSLNFPFTSSVSPQQAGALFGFTGKSVIARFGVSFRSADAACANAEEEVPDWNFDGVQGASAAAWEDVLSRIGVDTAAEDATVVELLYSSMYRANLVPANATGENPYWNSAFPFYDAFFCSWDTFRTVHPLISIHSPRAWSEIIGAYVDGWRNTGFIPECRANTKPGYVQGGDDGMVPVGDFAVKYGAHAAELGIPPDDLYNALVRTAEDTAPNWLTVGRQNTAWKTFGYIPTNWVDPSGSTGLPTREASRAFEYALGDFAVRQAGIALNKDPADIAKYANRSMNFVNMWNPNITHDGFSGFAQRRLQNGTFIFSSPDACSPIDPVGHSCARGTDNDSGFYECRRVIPEYSFFAPQSMSTIMNLMGGPDTFISRLDHYFSRGYFLAGNEPGFSNPWAYHYANRPDLSALRVRNVVYNNFNTGFRGIPGNDDSGAMASLLIFHLLGMYPVPASKQLLVGAPFVSGFTLHNDFFDTTTTFRVVNFDKNTLQATPPAGSNVFVKSITINGSPSASLCFLGFDNVVGGGEIVIEMFGDAQAAAAAGCAGPLPDSLETGGFAA
ncbi:Glycoside hydrolase family 92 protein [Mycena kentingensis (nom. inval.)]|nr:Glycoside hydrolase family 92 protein [Mycena kentingensis (nom. inval.)]